MSHTYRDRDWTRIASVLVRSRTDAETRKSVSTNFRTFVDGEGLTRIFSRHACRPNVAFSFCSLSLALASEVPPGVGKPTNRAGKRSSAFESPNKCPLTPPTPLEAALRTSNTQARAPVPHDQRCAGTKARRCVGTCGNGFREWKKRSLSAGDRPRRNPNARLGSLRTRSG